jgi:hypothetical protein
MDLIPIPPELLAIGLPVTVPDGRSGVIRHIYTDPRGQKVVVSFPDSKVYVLLASLCQAVAAVRDVSLS